MKKLILLLLLFPLVFLGQSPYSSYYENDNLKVAGESFEEIIEFEVSAKRCLNLRKSNDLKSKITGKLPYGMSVNVESKSGIRLTVIDADTETRIKSEIKGEWIEVTGYIVNEYDFSIVLDERLVF